MMDGTGTARRSRRRGREVWRWVGLQAHAADEGHGGLHVCVCVWVVVGGRDHVRRHAQRYVHLHMHCAERGLGSIDEGRRRPVHGGGAEAAVGGEVGAGAGAKDERGRVDSRRTGRMRMPTAGATRRGGGRR